MKHLPLIFILFVIGTIVFGAVRGCLENQKKPNISLNIQDFPDTPNPVMQDVDITYYDKEGAKIIIHAKELEIKPGKKLLGE